MSIKHENTRVKPFDMVDDAMVRVLRRKTERERLEIACGMWRSARDMLRSLVAAEHPDWPPDLVHLEVARRLASREA